MSYMELGDDPYAGGPVLPERDCFRCDRVGCTGCTRPGAVLAFDIETASADKLYLGEFEGDYVRLCGAEELDETWSYVGPLSAEYLAELEHASHLVGHNVFRFDIPALARHAGADFDALAAKAWDTAILERLVDPPGAKHATDAGYYGLDPVAQRYGHVGKTDDLAALARRHGPQLRCEGCTFEGGQHDKRCTGKKVYTDDRGTRIPGRVSPKARELVGYERIPVDDPEYRDYLRGDLAATRHVQRSVFSRVTNWDYAAREMRVAAIQNRMTFNGWRVDRELLADRVAEEDERRAAAVKRLSEDYGVPLVKADGEPSSAPWATKTGREALVEAFHAAGAEYLPQTDNGLLALGKLAMGDGYWVNAQGKRVPGMRNPEAYGLLPAVVELCEVLELATGASAKYAEIAGYVTPDGRVHGGIGEDQASGRWAMTRPSLTNIGKHGEKGEQRAPFVPEYSHVHLTCDLSQVDMRGVAALSQDAGYMALFAPGRDAHMDMAEVYFGARTKETRQRTKGINHKVNYGGSAYSTAQENGIPLDVVEAALLRRSYAYPRLLQWTEEAREQARNGHLLDNGFGRLMRCDPQRAHTQAPALMGQGCARDLMCEALLRLVALDSRVTPYLRAVVHDEVVLSVPAEEAGYWADVLRAAFTFSWRGVPILCEVSPPGRNWAECYVND